MNFRALLDQTPYAIGLALIALAGLVVYSNSFNAPFAFDDMHAIVVVPADERLPLTRHDWWSPRSLPYASFHVNYLLHELDVTGYHAVNLALHVVTAWLVSVLVYLLAKLSLPRAGNHQFMAVVAGLFFVVHPVQVQAVTYITQRMAIMATFFYFLALLGYCAYRRARGWPALGWAAVSLAATVAAMNSKSISATIPLAIVMLEIIFFSGWLKLWRRWQLIPWLLLLVIVPLHHRLLPFDLAPASPAGEIVAQESSPVAAALSRTVWTDEYSRSTYWITQINVLRTYWRLIFVPLGLTIDHEYPIFSSVANIPTVLSISLHVGLLALAIYMAHRKALLASFGIIFFYLVLSVESFIVLPDVLFEYRLYPALLALSLLVAEAAGRLPLRWRQYGLAGVVAAVLLLAAGTLQRNYIWSDEVRLWRDTVAKAPGKVRPHSNLGLAYAKRGEIAAAEREYLTALEIDPNFIASYVNLSAVMGQQGRYREAREYLEKAAALDSESAAVHSNLGTLLRLDGDFPAAVASYRRAIELNPDLGGVWQNLAEVLIELEDTEGAIIALRRVLEISPGDAGARNKLGALLSRRGDYEEAALELEEALRLDATLTAAFLNLGHAYAGLNRVGLADDMYARYIATNPRDGRGYLGRSKLWLGQGERERAQGYWQQAVLLSPKLVQ